MEKKKKKGTSKDKKGLWLPESESWGPGDASGWYWRDMTFSAGKARPAQLPSLRLMCVTSTPLGSDAGSTA